MLCPASEIHSEIGAVIKNGDGREYRAIIRDDYSTCSCHDSFYHRGSCKHTIAVCLTLLTQPEADNAIHLMWDNGHILCGATTVKRFWQNWTLNALNWPGICTTCVHQWTHPAEEVIHGNR